MKKIVIIIFSLLLLCSCGKTNKIDGEKFKEIIIKNELEVIDVTESYQNEDMIDYIEYAYDASIKDKYKIQFLKSSSKENMDVIFKVNKEEFETYKTGVYTSGTVENINSIKYTLNNDNYYIYMRQVEDTLLYVIAKKEYKNEVNKIIDDIGY